jgi:hypothetical protein
MTQPRAAFDGEGKPARAVAGITELDNKHVGGAAWHSCMSRAHHPRLVALARHAKRGTAGAFAGS